MVFNRENQSSNRYLRPLQSSDQIVLREVYEDAICTAANSFYSQEQIDAWSGLAYLPGVLDKPLNEGKGWASCVDSVIEAFAVKYPKDRLALLYCRGRSSRQGHATDLLNKIDEDAQEDEIMRLSTEASLFSYQLFLSHGWKTISPETIKIGGVIFCRYLMEKRFD